MPCTASSPLRRAPRCDVGRDGDGWKGTLRSEPVLFLARVGACSERALRPWLFTTVTFNKVCVRTPVCPCMRAYGLRACVHTSACACACVCVCTRPHALLRSAVCIAEFLHGRRTGVAVYGEGVSDGGSMWGRVNSSACPSARVAVSSAAFVWRENITRLRKPDLITQGINEGSGSCPTLRGRGLIPWGVMGGWLPAASPGTMPA